MFYREVAKWLPLALEFLKEGGKDEDFANKEPPSKTDDFLAELVKHGMRDLSELIFEPMERIKEIMDEVEDIINDMDRIYDKMEEYVNVLHNKFKSNQDVNELFNAIKELLEKHKIKMDKNYISEVYKELEKHRTELNLVMKELRKARKEAEKVYFYSAVVFLCITLRLDDPKKYTEKIINNMNNILDEIFEIRKRLSQIIPTSPS